MAPWIVVSLHSAPISLHLLKGPKGRRLRIYIIYVYFVYFFTLFRQSLLPRRRGRPFPFPSRYYYPETLRPAGNSKSLKVIRSDLINEFYYLAVMCPRTEGARAHKFIFANHAYFLYCPSTFFFPPEFIIYLF